MLDSCDPPPGLYFAELLYAYKDKSSYPVGSVVKYKCQLGYTKQPEMPFFITCLASMKWSSFRVLCKSESLNIPVLIIREVERIALPKGTASCLKSLNWQQIKLYNSAMLHVFILN